MRNVMITGASRGVGLAVAETLAAAGYRVIGVSRTLSGELQAAQDKARAGGKGAIDHVAFDLGEIDRIHELVSSSRRAHGKLFALINNAAIGTPGMLAIMPDFDIAQLLKLNVNAPIVLTKFVVRHMIADNAGGRIINVSSIIGFTGYNGLSVYGATKSAMLGFTRSLAREVGQSNITVNAIAPGFMDTEMTKSLGGDQRDQISRRSALRRLVEAGDVAKAIEFLLGDAGRNVTGTTLTIDAGSTA